MSKAPPPASSGPRSVSRFKILNATAPMISLNPDTMAYLQDPQGVRAENGRKAAKKIAKKLFPFVVSNGEPTTKIDMHLQCIESGKDYKCSVVKTKLDKPRKVKLGKTTVTYEHDIKVVR